MNSPAQSSVSFIVLALNEENYIEATVRNVLKGVEISGLGDYQIILVDDGSTDKTGEIMDRLAGQNSKFKALHNPRNLGIGGAYKQGLRVATCEYIMTIAGDDIMPASDVALQLEHVGEADIIFPILTNTKLRTLKRRIGSHGFTLLINLLFGLNVSYYQGALPRRELLNKIDIKINSHAFPAEIGVKLLKAGCTYVEVAIPNTPSKSGNSVALQPKRLLAVFKDIFTLVSDVRKSRANSLTSGAKASPSSKKQI